MASGDVFTVHGTEVTLDGTSEQLQLLRLLQSAPFRFRCGLRCNQIVCCAHVDREDLEKEGLGGRLVVSTDF